MLVDSEIPDWIDGEGVPGRLSKRLCEADRDRLLEFGGAGVFGGGKGADVSACARVLSSPEPESERGKRSGIGMRDGAECHGPSGGPPGGEEEP